jgi:hypothetical protein
MADMNKAVNFGVLWENESPQLSGEVVPIRALQYRATFAEGTTVSSPIDMGSNTAVRTVLQSSAVSGTNPTLDLTMQTSRDGKVWRTLGSAFTQVTAAYPTLSSVTSAGTLPPTITLTGTAVRPINLKIKVGTTGARGTWTAYTSVDGGITYQGPYTSAATLTLYDEDSVSTGVTINIATGDASANNTWTASTLGYQEQVFATCSRYIRHVALVGGTSTPTVTATLDLRVD